MPEWTQLIRFIAVEDDQVHLGQLVDTTRDVGLDTLNEVPVRAYLINGDVFTGKITEHVYTVKKLLSPITREQCSFIRCLGLNYKDHAKEAGLDLPQAPVLFAKSRMALADPYPAAITIRVQDETSDYEAELCVVIGASGRDISEDKALDYILGYTSLNDVSARTMQMLTAQWSFSKGLDNSCPIGPVLVSAAAIPDPQKLTIKAIYNGRTVQDGHTSDMIFDMKQQISYLSQGTTLEVGSIILTGTPAGIGYFRQPRLFLEDGSDIRVENEKIGTLVSKVKYESH